MSRYIHQLQDWPGFRWNQEALAAPLAEIRHRQGRLLGRMEGLGFTLQKEAELETLTLDVVKSSEIEGERLDPEQVRSSIARRLGLDAGGTEPADRPSPEGLRRASPVDPPSPKATAGKPPAGKRVATEDTEETGAQRSNRGAEFSVAQLLCVKSVASVRSVPLPPMRRRAREPSSPEGLRRASPVDRDVERVVEMMLDATQKFAAPLTGDRLFAWHAALFPTGRSGMRRIIVGAWRDDATGPMQVVSGPAGKEKVHYEAPAAPRLPDEMGRFLTRANEADRMDAVLRAALAHLWFVTIHPFDDGNGRIARAIADWQLARSENSAQRFYSMSAQIRIERNDYYDILERTQKGPLDITPWLEWFLGCLGRAFDATETTLQSVMRKARFWERAAHLTINDRQRLVLNRLLDGFTGKLTTKRWAVLAKSSHDTALRDIQSLIDQRLLKKDEGGGRSTSYSLVLE